MYDQPASPIDSSFKFYPTTSLLLPFTFHPGYCGSLLNGLSASILPSLRTLLRTLSRGNLLKHKSDLITPWLNALTVVSPLTLYKQSPHTGFQSGYVRATCCLSKTYLPLFCFTLFHPLWLPGCSWTHQASLPQDHELATPSAWYALPWDLCLVSILTSGVCSPSHGGLPRPPFEKQPFFPTLFHLPSLLYFSPYININGKH